MQRVRLLGEIQIDGPDGLITGRAVQRARLALLAVLAASRTNAVSRERLMALLWPESESDRAHALLRDAIYRLRASLAQPAVIATSAELRLDPAYTSCDVWDFEDAVARGDVECADGLYRGPFIDGFSLRHSAEFDQWADAERRRMADMHARALESIAEQQGARGDWHGAVSSWRRLAVADPYNGRIATRLMEALDASGDRAGALKQAALHSSLLQADLGAAPDPLVSSYAATLRLGEPRRTSPPDRDRPTEATDERREAAVTRTPGSPTTAEDLPERPSRSTVVRLRVAVATGAVVLALSLAAYSAIRFVRFPKTELGTDSGVEKSGANRASTSTVASRSRTMVVTDFRAAPEDTDLARLAAVELRIALGQSGLVRVMSPEGTANALRRMRRRPSEMISLETAREIARREGTSVILDGTLSRLSRSGSALLVTARVIAADSETVLAVASDTAASPAKLVDAADSVSRRLRIKLGEPIRDVADTPPLAKVTTASFEALELYTVASRANAEGDFPRAVALLKDAVAIDSQFASAWVLLRTASIAYGVSGFLASPQATSDAEAHAFRLRERLPRDERLVVEGSYYVARDRGRAIAAYEELFAREFPGSGARLGELLNTRRDYSRSERVLRAAWTPGEPPSTDLIISLLNQGKTREADSLLLVYSNASAVHRGMRINVLCDRGPSRECERLLDSASASGSQESKVKGIQLQSDLALLKGQIARSNRLWAEWDALNRARGGISGFGPYGDVIRANQIDANIRHRPQLAVARLDSVGSPPTRAYQISAMAEMCAVYGLLDRARALLRRFEAERLDTVTGPTEWFQDQLNIAKARIAFGERRWNDALVAWKTMDTWPDGPSLYQKSIGLLRFSGTVYDSAGMTDSAIVTYERYLSTPTYHRLEYDEFSLASIYERLGQLYERARNPKRASFFYEKFIDLWKDADPELQPRVQEARRRIAQLR